MTSEFIEFILRYLFGPSSDLVLILRVRVFVTPIEDGDVEQLVPSQVYALDLDSKRSRDLNPWSFLG